MNLIQFTGAIELGLVYGLIALGVYLSFRVIDFPDLTVDGSFPMGAAIASAGIVAGWHPALATLIAILGGAAAGCVTAYLHVRWGIMELLAGILTMTGLYSINLRIMGRPNIALLNQSTLFDLVDKDLIILGIVGMAVAGCLIYFFKTEIGLAARATGNNKQVSLAQGVSVKWMIVMMLALSNGIVALGGALFAQSEGFADITIGPGTIIVGLASVIIGEAIFRTRRIHWLIIGCITGSIIYRIAIALALKIEDLGLNASDMRLITAVLITVTMIIPKLRKQGINS